MCACGSLHWPRLPRWSDSILSKRAWRHGWQRRLCLSVEQHQHKRVREQKPGAGAGLASWLQHQAVCSRPPSCRDFQQAGLSFLQPSSNPGFHTRLMGLFTGCLALRLGCLTCGSDPFILRDTPEPAATLACLGHALGVSPQPDGLLLFLPDSVWIFLYSCDFRRAIL